MVSENGNSTRNHILKKMGLNNTDSMVYYALMKFGEDGTTVYNLIRALQNSFKRTTLYTILDKLVNLEIVEIIDNNSSPRNARIYRVISPKEYFANFLEQKKRELRELEEISNFFMHELEKIYLYGKREQLGEINEFLQPYIKNLLDKGWKINLYSKEENIPVFNCSVYECYLGPPNTIIFNDVPFHIFIFNYNITEDKNALQFVINSIKNQSKQLIKIYGSIEHFTLKERKYSYLDEKFPAYVINIPTNAIKTHFLLPKILEFLNIEKAEDLPEEIDVGIGVIIPIENKVFYLWAESKSYIDEILRIIYELNFT